MKKKKRPKKKDYTHPWKKVPDSTIPWTATARALYDETYWYAVRGCFKSNATLSADLGHSERSIRRARQFLARHQLIVTVRTLPRTWSMWSRFHPAIRNCQVLYFRGGQIDNPWYEPRPTSDSGGTKCPLGGDKMSPKLEQLKGCPTDTPLPKDSRGAESTSSTENYNDRSNAAGLAVQGGKGKKKNYSRIRMSNLERWYELRRQYGNTRQAYAIFEAECDLGIYDND